MCTGADLEAGWLPILVRESGNATIQRGRPGYFEAAQYVAMMDVPTRLDRSDGDVHALGNPHVHTDPRNLLPIAAALANQLVIIDPGNAPSIVNDWRISPTAGVLPLRNGQRRWGHCAV